MIKENGLSREERGPAQKPLANGQRQEETYNLILFQWTHTSALQILQRRQPWVYISGSAIIAWTPGDAGTLTCSSLGRWICSCHVEVPLKINRTTIQSGNPTTGSTTFLILVCVKRIGNQSQWGICLSMLGAAIHNSQRWAWPKCPSMGEWIRKMWYRHIDIQTHTQEYYSPPTWKFQLCKRERVVEMGCTTMWMYLTLWNCTRKSSQMVIFRLCILPWNKEKRPALRNKKSYMIPSCIPCARYNFKLFIQIDIKYREFKSQ